MTVPNLMRLSDVSHDSSVLTMTDPPFAYKTDETTPSDIEHVSRIEMNAIKMSGIGFISETDRFF